jgi:hypothetical protein
VWEQKEGLHTTAQRAVSQSTAGKSFCPRGDRISEADKGWDEGQERSCEMRRLLSSAASWLSPLLPPCVTVIADALPRAASARRLLAASDGLQGEGSRRLLLSASLAASEPRCHCTAPFPPASVVSSSPPHSQPQSQQHSQAAKVRSIGRLTREDGVAADRIIQRP